MKKIAKKKKLPAKKVLPPLDERKSVLVGLPQFHPRQTVEEMVNMVASQMMDAVEEGRQMRAAGVKHIANTDMFARARHMGWRLEDSAIEMTAALNAIYTSQHK